MPDIIKDVTAYTGGNKDGSIGGTYRVDQHGIIQKTWHETYYVQADAPTQDEDYILGNTPGLPQMGALTRKGWCINAQAKCISDSAMLWECVYTYNSEAPLRLQDYLKYDSDLQAWFPTAPHNQLPLYDWDTETFELVIPYDQQSVTEIYGEPPTYVPVPIVNFVGEPFHLTTIYAIMVLQVEKYERGRYAQWWDTYNYINTLCSDEIFSAPEQCALMSDIRSEELGLLPQFADMMEENPGDPPNKYLPYFIRRTYTLKFKFKLKWEGDMDTGKWEIDTTAKGWSSELIEQGTKVRIPDPEYDGGGTAPLVLRSASDIEKAPNRPLLDYDGTLLPEGSEPIYSEWNRFRARSWHLLKLEPSDWPDSVQPTGLGISSINDWNAMINTLLSSPGNLAPQRNPTS